jgi:SOUL heme-binding protein
LAIEAAIDDADQEKAAGEAFGLLFRYITGANRRDQKIAMTAPVQIASERVAMTMPVQTAAQWGG